MRFTLRELLRAEAGDGNAGGSGNTGAGSGEGNSGGGALTPEAIAKLVSDSVNAALNGYDKKVQAKLKALETKGAPAPAANSDDDETPPPATNKQQGGVDPEVARLRKQNEQIQKRLAEQESERAREKEAAKADRLESAVRSQLAKFSFLDDDNFEAGYAAVMRGVKYADDGSIVGGPDELPLGKFVEGRMKKLSTLLRPQDVGGAGVANGGKQPAAGSVDFNQIKPGMSADDIARVTQSIANAWK